MEYRDECVSESTMEELMDNTQENQKGKVPRVYLTCSSVAVAWFKLEV